MAFEPNPLNFVAYAEVEQGTVHFRDAEDIVQYWPREGFDPGSPLTIEAAYDSKSGRLNAASWTLEDLGPVVPASSSSMHSPRLAKLIFNGLKFSTRNLKLEASLKEADRKEAVLRSQRADEDAISKARLVLSEEERQDRALYDAFLLGDLVQLCVPLGTIDAAPGPSGGSKKKVPYRAGLMIRLGYGRRQDWAMTLPGAPTP
jgi:hypothetical protein